MGMRREKPLRPAAPVWAMLLIDVYFDMYPSEETMREYKDAGLDCYQYWHGELKKILTSRWHLRDPSFQSLRPFVDHVLVSYPDTDVLEVATMRYEDRKALLQAFCNDLGMHTDIFPFTVNDF